jgi:hypothetical protein
MPLSGAPTWENPAKNIAEEFEEKSKKEIGE